MGFFGVRKICRESIESCNTHLGRSSNISRSVSRFSSRFHDSISVTRTRDPKKQREKIHVNIPPGWFFTAVRLGLDRKNIQAENGKPIRGRNGRRQEKRKWGGGGSRELHFVVALVRGAHDRNSKRRRRPQVRGGPAGDAGGRRGARACVSSWDAPRA